MLLFIVFALSMVSTQFAGAGLTVNTYTFNNEEFQFNCSTNDDCYNLLCWFLSDPSYALIIIQPNPWAGDCSTLFPYDSNLINATLYCYVRDRAPIDIYPTYNMSYLAQILCQLGHNPNITQIDYFYLNC